MKISRNNLKSENEILKRILNNGYVLINYDSTDCDGCSTSKVLKFTNLNDIYKAIDNEQEYCEGSFTYSVPLMFPDGSLDLNDNYNGGQW